MSVADCRRAGQRMRLRYRPASKRSVAQAMEAEKRKAERQERRKKK